MLDCWVPHLKIRSRVERGFRFWRLGSSGGFGAQPMLREALADGILHSGKDQRLLYQLPRSLSHKETGGVSQSPAKLAMRCLPTSDEAMTLIQLNWRPSALPIHPKCLARTIQPSLSRLNNSSVAMGKKGTFSSCLILVKTNPKVNRKKKVPLLNWDASMDGFILRSP